jgi:hypothetical protein
LEKLNKIHICAREGKGKILCYEAGDKEADKLGPKSK